MVLFADNNFSKNNLRPNAMPSTVIGLSAGIFMAGTGWHIQIVMNMTISGGQRKNWVLLTGQQNADKKEKEPIWSREFSSDLQN